MFGFRAVTVVVHIVGNVQFAADDIFEPAFFALLCKIQTGIHIAVIGYGAGIYAVFLHVVHQIFHFRHAVEKQIFGMHV